METRTIGKVRNIRLAVVVVRGLELNSIQIGRALVVVASLVVVVAVDVVVVVVVAAVVVVVVGGNFRLVLHKSVAQQLLTSPGAVSFTQKSADVQPRRTNVSSAEFDTYLVYNKN